MCKKCQDCKYFSQYYEFHDKQYIQCQLTNAILTDKAAEKCDCYNINLDGMSICFNCRYFGGGSDWGLACRKHYHALSRATDRMCKDGVFKEDKKVKFSFEDAKWLAICKDDPHRYVVNITENSIWVYDLRKEDQVYEFNNSGDAFIQQLLCDYGIHAELERK